MTALLPGCFVGLALMACEAEAAKDQPSAEENGAGGATGAGGADTEARSDAMNSGTAPSESAPEPADVDEGEPEVVIPEAATPTPAEPVGVDEGEPDGPTPALPVSRDDAGSVDAGVLDDGAPVGDLGIAAGYPNDEGIEDHPDVLFADDFESYGAPEELWQRWDSVYQEQLVTFGTEAENVYAGRQSLEFTIPQMEEELSDAVDKVLGEEQDLLYLRYYSKFLPPYDVVGSTHNGASISAHYFIDGQATPGVPADGTNKFLVNLEHWRGEPETPSPGHLNVYVYHPEQRSQWGDHWFPTGTALPYSSEPYFFGDDFVPREDLLPELDRWYCYEYMVRANTPGARDGRVSIWIDGVLVADFGALRFRDVDSLRIDRFGLSFHIGSNPNGEARKWFDNVVAATSYIGPLAR